MLNLLVFLNVRANKSADGSLRVQRRFDIYPPLLWVIPILPLPFLTRAPLSIHHQVLEEATSVLHPPTSSQGTDVCLSVMTGV